MKFFLFLSLIVSLNSYGQVSDSAVTIDATTDTTTSAKALPSSGKMYKVLYIVEQNDNLAKIFRRFVYPDSIITKNTPMTQKTFTENPDISDWNVLPPGKKVDLYIAAEYMDLKKYEAYNKLLSSALARLKRANETENGLDDDTPQGLKASIFYMASSGQFTQANSQANISFSQNSPITLGSSFSFYPKETQWSFAAAAYFSHLLASSSNLDSSTVNVPLEIGANFYNEYRFHQYNFTGYFGLDYEKFSTFNMYAVQQEQRILLDQNSVAYLTVGFSRLVNVFGSPFFTKLSFSQSLTSSIETTAGSNPSDESYSGFKILWYVNKKFNNRIFLHSLFKYHIMDGPSELTTLRLGLGFGYILF